MKTRRELIAEVEALGRDLGEEVSTDRLNNAALSELAAGMRARLEEKARLPSPPVPDGQREPSELTEPPSPPVAARQLQGDRPRPPPPVIHDPPPQPQGVDGAAPAGAGGPPPPKAEQPKPPRAAYYVAPGRSIAVGGRVLGPFKPVKPSDFAGGQTDLDYFVLKGAVVRNQ